MGRAEMMGLEVDAHLGLDSDGRRLCTAVSTPLLLWLPRPCNNNRETKTPHLYGHTAIQPVRKTKNINMVHINSARGFI